MLLNTTKLPKNTNLEGILALDLSSDQSCEFWKVATSRPATHGVSSLFSEDINYDLKIVCFNNLQWIGNGFLIPAGPLREKVKSVQKYDAVVLNGDPNLNKFIIYLYFFTKELNFIISYI
mgnify:CR=1 FL=1